MTTKDEKIEEGKVEVKETKTTTKKAPSEKRKQKNLEDFVKKDHR